MYDIRMAVGINIGCACRNRTPATKLWWYGTQMVEKEEKRMIAVRIILCAIAYFAIGGFLNGLANDEELETLFRFLWPVALILVIIYTIMYVPEMLGEHLRSRFDYPSTVHQKEEPEEQDE